MKTQISYTSTVAAFDIKPLFNRDLSIPGLRTIIPLEVVAVEGVNLSEDAGAESHVKFQYLANNNCWAIGFMPEAIFREVYRSKLVKESIADKHVVGECITNAEMAEEFKAYCIANQSKPRAASIEDVRDWYTDEVGTPTLPCDKAAIAEIHELVTGSPE